MQDEQSPVKRQIGGSNENSMNLLSTESWWKEESNETKINWFGIIVREISYFQNQQFVGPKIGENEEHYELICKIKLLNLIKIQIISWQSIESHY